MFLPKSEYDVISDKIEIRDFHAYTEDFVTRPPYQRKNVWSPRKQQALLDSLFRRYYVPKLVLREVRLSDDRVVREVVDGQQRIVTVQKFFDDELRLPKSLASLDPSLPDKRYSQLEDKIRKFVDKDLKYEADVIKNIDNPKSPEHQSIATEIFWRLQQGESLNFMEVAHARLSSLLRNFIVKYSDDIAFDYENYVPLDENPSKHPFFRIIDRKNDRMQHLALLGRLLLIERANGPTDIRDSMLGDWIDETQQGDGVDNLTFEKSPYAVSLLKTLNRCHEIFKSDSSLDEDNGLKEFTIEYFIISVVMLIRHLFRNYAVGTEHHEILRKFVYAFHARWKDHKEDDRDILVFADNRQQSEAERIRIYRKQDGQCQMCLEEGLSPEEAKVSWSQFQADHIYPWIKGGETQTWNGQVLCTVHNASKGGR